MSVLFGMWNLDGKAVDPEHIAKTRRMLEPYAPGGVTICFKGALVMLFGAVHTAPESRRGQQPLASPSGTFLMWDGCLDNRSELRRTIPTAGPNDADVELVASHWERHGTQCLGGLIGDWAMSIFLHYERMLILAKDFLGTRPLYYVRCNRYVAWSSLLEPLVALPDKLTLCERYLAGWLSGFPEAHLTPYQEIHAVPPASWVRITSRTAQVQRYWDFSPHPIRMQSDAAYEEQFRVLFFDAVRRRLRSGAPVLAELSGGMDSSAIVCAADRLVAEENVPPVETVSFFDDSEPNWNERPFFSAVEAQRDHIGFHLNVASDGQLLPARDGSLPVTPVYGARPSEVQMDFSEFLSRGHFHILLSGIGGDEFTGGVPTGIPELADLVRSGQIRTFLRRAFLWSLPSRKPLLHTVTKTVRSLLPTLWVSRSNTPWPMPWVKPSFLTRNRRFLGTQGTGYRWLGPAPTFQENLRALDGLRRQIACAELPPSPSCEKRYPFLDRDLLEFLFNIPRNQLVRPDERRSLLRRALRGIVPDVVLGRRRKAFVVASQLKEIATDWTRVSQLVETMSLESWGVIDSGTLADTLDEARRGSEVPLLAITRVLRLEWWLQDPAIQHLFSESSGIRAKNSFLSFRTELTEK